MRRGTEIHVVNGEDVARRQLSQWQCKVQFGVPSYRNVIEPHRHLPSTAFKSCALPAAMEVATLLLARILCQWQSVRQGSGWPNSTVVLLSGGGTSGRKGDGDGNRGNAVFGGGTKRCGQGCPHSRDAPAPPTPWLCLSAPLDHCVG